jgi:hypothetical protein
MVLSFLLVCWSQRSIAFAAISEVVTTTAVGSSDFVVDLPATVNNGDLLILIGGGDAASGSGAITVSGWTLVGASGGGTNSSGIWWRAGVSGDSGGTATLDYQFSSSFAVHAAQVLRITGWDSGTDPEFSAFASSNNSAPAPGAVTASWGAEDNLFITAINTGDDDVALTISSTGYSVISELETGSAANDFFKVRHQYLESTAASDAPSAWTLAASQVWNGATIVVRGASAGTIIPLIMHHRRQD